MSAAEESSRGIFYYGHVNKKTKKINFVKAIGSKAKGSNANGVLNQLGEAREAVLELISTPPEAQNVSELGWCDRLKTVLDVYLALAQGLLHEKLRSTAIMFEWSSVFGSQSMVSQNDAAFEVASLLMACAFELMGRAQRRVEARDGWVGEAFMKDTYRLLKVAAGLFEEASRQADKLEGKARGSCPDFDLAVGPALVKQCLAEAQELVVARAILQKNKDNVVAGLARDTAEKFEQALSGVQALQLVGVAKWRAYLQTKTNCYYAYAYVYQGLVVLEDEECGQSIKLGAQAETLCTAARDHAKAFESAKPKSKPRASEFQYNLQRWVTLNTKKFERDNGFIYHKPVPADLPDLIAGKCLVQVEPLEMPATAPAWTAAVYDAFDESVTEKLSVKGSTDNLLDVGVEREKGRAWWRYLILALCMPLLLVLTIVGALVWVALLPIKLLCCPIGCVAQAVANVFEWMVKAPFKGLRWAANGDLRAEQKAKDAEKGDLELSSNSKMMDSKEQRDSKISVNPRRESADSRV